MAVIRPIGTTQITSKTKLVKTTANLTIEKEDARVKQVGRNRSDFAVARALTLGAKKKYSSAFFFSSSLRALPLLVFGLAFEISF